MRRNTIERNFSFQLLSKLIKIFSFLSFLFSKRNRMYEEFYFRKKWFYSLVFSFLFSKKNERRLLFLEKVISYCFHSLEMKTTFFFVVIFINEKIERRLFFYWKSDSLEFLSFARKVKRSKKKTVIFIKVKLHLPFVIFFLWEKNFSI